MSKKILLFSSGMDSYLMKLIYRFKDEECLFVDMGTKENAIEKKIIGQHYPYVNQYYMPLVNFELEDKIIPFRNYFLALIGAQYSSNIYFAFTKGDVTKDKDYVFKSQVESILNYFSLDEDKVHNKGPYTITMPFKSMTKKEIIDKCLRLYPLTFLVDDIFEKSISCYNGGIWDKPCGQCPSCYRKFAAIACVGGEDLCRDKFFIDPRKGLSSWLEYKIEKDGVTKEIEDIRSIVCQK